MVIAPPTAPLAARPVAAPQGARPAFGAVLEAKAARLASAPAPAAPAPQPALESMRAIERAQHRLDAVLDAARRGKTFTVGELLSIQTEAYRFAQTVDLASRLVEHGAQAIKQAMNTQL